MTDEESLLELSLLYGIEPFYWDIHGVQHITSDETRKSLLASMGVPCESAAEVTRSLESALKARWTTVFPPVAVYWSGADAVVFEIRHDEEERAELEWDFESAGRIALTEMRVLEEKEIAGTRYFRREVRLPLGPDAGYHSLKLRLGAREREVLLLSAPAKCYFPDPPGRSFGVAAQLYSLRSSRNLGIGDCGDISAAIPTLAESGSKFVGLNPLHALFERSPDNFSPYSPSTRLGWNTLVIAVDELPELARSPGAQALLANEDYQRRAAAARDAELVDYGAVWQLKLEVLEEIFKSVPAEEGFEEFCRSCSAGMLEQAQFAALREQLLDADAMNWGWPAWPEEYRDPRGAAATEFFSARKDRVRFYLFLQYLADRQLKELNRRLSEAGVSFGLYLDLALGSNIGGAETWFRQELYALTASMGAPPDELGPLGQNWGLPPLVPERLREARLEPFRRAVALAMSAASALRIDHIMSLYRLFWIPQGGTAKDGAYVRYPFEELLAVVCIESDRNRCVVIGEDLGTVPDEVRVGMRERGILSYNVLYFMHHDRAFLPSERYPPVSLMVTSTHDLPTVRTFWNGSDIELRKTLKLYPTPDVYPLAKKWREQDRHGLFERLTAEGFTNVPKPESRDLTKEEIISLHAFQSTTPCYLQAVQIEDLERLRDQANVPGTVHEQPNWRRKMKRPLEKILTSAFSKELLAAVGRGRAG